MWPSKQKCKMKYTLHFHYFCTIYMIFYIVKKWTWKFEPNQRSRKHTLSCMKFSHMLNIYLNHIISQFQPVLYIIYLPGLFWILLCTLDVCSTLNILRKMVKFDITWKLSFFLFVSQHLVQIEHSQILFCWDEIQHGCLLVEAAIVKGTRTCRSNTSVNEHILA